MTRIRLRLSGEQTSRWNWLARYRTWEANRKVFLYPENSLEPDEPAKGAAKRDTTVRRRPDDES